MEPLTSRPETSSFIPLSVHQSRTPDSFHSGPAILHYHSSHCKLIIPNHDLTSSPPLNTLRNTAPEAAINGNAHPATSQGPDEEPETNVVIDGLDVWITSDKFLLYNPSTSTGVSIPYPSISLHAIQRLTIPAPAPSTNGQPPPQPETQGLYMHITKVAGVGAAPYPQESDEEESITMTLVPPSIETESTGQGQGGSEEPKPEEEEEGIETPTQKLYDAVSACSNLHPDPVEEEEEGGGGAFASGLVFPGNGEGGLPPPVDGSSGWITAENMHEYFDEEGNWIGGGEEPSLSLGPGAGTVRTREEGDEQAADEGDEGDVNGMEETKWRRTD